MKTVWNVIMKKISIAFLLIIGVVFTGCSKHKDISYRLPIKQSERIGIMVNVGNVFEFRKIGKLFSFEGHYKYREIKTWDVDKYIANRFKEKLEALGYKEVYILPLSDEIIIDKSSRLEAISIYDRYQEIIVNNSLNAFFYISNIIGDGARMYEVKNIKTGERQLYNVGNLSLVETKEKKLLSFSPLYIFGASKSTVDDKEGAYTFRKVSYNHVNLDWNIFNHNLELYDDKNILELEKFFKSLIDKTIDEYFLSVKLK